MPPDTPKALQLYARWRRKVEKQAQQDCAFALAEKKPSGRARRRIQSSLHQSSLLPSVQTGGTSQWP